ncbi:MAG: alpha/beta hydrolase fold protein [Parcubacteria group bacterium Licking1014_17]|nr:MAG: alpha/beta hydrolase fold protein [Parcubacteria group bacterium Licking1014_17]
MIDPEKKFVATNAGNIYYFSHFVSKDRPTVLLLHGLSSNHTTWLYLMDVLAKNNINSIAPDLRGHGYSDMSKKRSRYRIPALRKDIELIMKNEGLKGAHLVGYSYGGYIGIDLAIANPPLVKSLVLISTNHVSPMKYSWLSFLSGSSYVFLNTLAYLLIWQKRKKYLYFEQNKSRGYWDSTFKGYLTMPLPVNFWMLSEVFRLNYAESLKNIACPTLILHGKGDIFISDREIKDMADKIRNCRVVHLESGHFLASRYQEEVAEKTLQFVNQLR